MYITYAQPDGSLSIVVPCTDINDALKDVPQGVEYKIIESLDMDYDFFNAYEFDAEEGVKLSIARAKEIQIRRFRNARSALLAKLDIDYMRAVESGNTSDQQIIAQKKQALRDITQTYLPDDLEGIKNTWPAILNEK